MPGGAAPLDFDAAASDALDAEIRSVFDAGHLITPDQVQRRSRHPARRRPGRRLADAGAGARARSSSPSTKGRRRWPAIAAPAGRWKVGSMFVNTDEASPAAAYLTLNDPIADHDRIQAAVRAGFVVRTRADADTVEARAATVEPAQRRPVQRGAVCLDRLPLGRPALPLL
jgi:hypothetical protein